MNPTSRMMLTAAIGVALAGAASAQQANQSTAPTPLKAQESAGERIYGSQMMTAKEREEYHRRIRAAKTEQEREQIRKEHHTKMQERAKERGLKLPDEPPARGPGAGGMGPGGGGMGGGGMGGGGMGGGGRGR